MPGKPCVAVAWSGGRDSTALLHATLAAARPLGLRVAALHVHHGLNPRADDWLAHCRSLALRWARRGHALVFRSERLAGSPPRGHSVEAWARQARYRALRAMALAEGAGLVLLAHHGRDQAETVLLQALRGAGTAGLAGMPAMAERDGLLWARPWLGCRSEAIAAYVRRHRLVHIDDDSNADPRFARNRLRLRVWPRLIECFADADAALAGTAAWAREATQCLAELAAADLATIANEQGLSLAGWRDLSVARRQNALRHWLAGRLGRPAPASLIQRLGDELDGAGARAWPVEQGSLRRHRGWLRFVPEVRATGPAKQRETTLAIRRAGRHRLPGWGGVLIAERVAEGGVPLAWLAHLELRERRGGEQYQAGLGRPARSLKKQFQAAGVPAWERDGPLVYSGGQLVFVPGLGLDARVIGLPGQAQVTLRWVGQGATADRAQARG